MTGEDPAIVLVVANETLAGRELIDAVKRRAAQGPVRAVVVAPVNDPVAGYVVYQHTRRAAAGRRLERTLSALGEAGIPAHGGVFGHGPLDAVKDILAQEHIDELIVSTHPEAKSGWLRRDLIDEIRKAAAPRPVEHVVADVAAATGTSNVLVVANETVISKPLLDAIRQRAGQSAASFLIISPQSDPAGGEHVHPEAERRLRTALSELRSEGVDAHGQIAHPDPYTAAMETIHDERVDEVIVSTFPGERSGWLRRDLVGRLRADAGVPIQHVVVDAPAASRLTGAAT
jgi:phosphopantetheine adenylyltransferase